MIAPVFSLLTAAPAVTALVAERIYRHGRATPKGARPYITWLTVGGHAESYLAEPPTTDQELTQIDCWSTTAAECKQLMRAVVAALESDGYMAGQPMDDFEEETELYRYTLQFYFWTSRE